MGVAVPRRGVLAELQQRHAFYTQIFKWVHPSWLVRTILKPAFLRASARKIHRNSCRPDEGNRFSTELGSPPKVLISIEALSYLLSSVPDSGLGADSLRRALFEFGHTAHLTDAERKALRIIRDAETYDIPWAERELLEANLSAAIRSEAEKRVVKEAQLRSKLASGNEPKTSAKLIADSLRDLAAKDKTREEFKEAERKIEELQSHIIALEEGLKAAKSSAKS